MNLSPVLTPLRRLVLLLAMIFTLPSLCSAQDFFDYLKDSEYGTGLQMMTLKENAREPDFPGDTVLEELTPFGIAASIGWNFPVYHLSEGMALGISPNFEMAVAMSAEDFRQGQFATITAPVLLTFKYGGDAEYHNQKGFGVTAGLGGLYGYMIGTAEALSYAAPLGMAEVNYARRDMIIKLRYMSMLTSTDVADAQFSFHQHGIYLVLGGDW